jgi:hypothetical protein
MEQRANVEGGRLRRVLSRALLTVGGAVGITAAAWVLSAATASAGTTGDQLLPVPSAANSVNSHSPEPASADDGVHEMAKAVALAAKPAVNSTSGSLGGMHQVSAVQGHLTDAADVDRFSHQIKSDIERAGKHIATPLASALVDDSVTLVGHVTQFPLATLPMKLPIPVIGTGLQVPAPGSDHSTDSAVAGTNPAQASVSTVLPAAMGGNTAANKQHGQHLLPARSSDQPGPRNSAPVPMAPASVPSAPCCTGNGGPGFPGGPSFVGQLVYGNTLGAAAIRAIKAISQSVSVTTGKQAGVTPD